MYRIDFDSAMKCVKSVIGAESLNVEKVVNAVSEAKYAISRNTGQIPVSSTLAPMLNRSSTNKLAIAEVIKYYKKLKVDTNAINYFLQLCERENLPYSIGIKKYGSFISKFEKKILPYMSSAKSFEDMFKNPEEYKSAWQIILSVSNNPKLKRLWQNLDVTRLKELKVKDGDFSSVEEKLKFLKDNFDFLYSKELSNVGGLPNYFRMQNFNEKNAKTVIEILQNKKYGNVMEHLNPELKSFSNLAQCNCDIQKLFGKIELIVRKENINLFPKPKNGSARFVLKNIEIKPNNIDLSLTDVKFVTSNGIEKLEMNIVLDENSKILSVQKNLGKDIPEVSDKVLTTTYVPARKQLIKSEENIEAIYEKPKLLYEKEIIKIKNPITGKIETQIIEQSDLPGILNVSKVKADGTKIPLVSATKICNVVEVKKNFESLDGTRTLYNFTENVQSGNRSLKYQIIDKDGNILLNQNESFERQGDKAISIVNGKRYEITEKAGKILVQNLENGEVHKIDIVSINPRVDVAVDDILSSLSGEELIGIHEKVKKIHSLKYSIESTFDIVERKITTNGLSAFEHEYGHAKSHFIDMISNDKTLNELYNYEKELFIKAFGKKQHEHIGYFIDKERVANSYHQAPLEELIAETNLLLHYSNEMPELRQRFYYLQQYFPKTIAHCAKLLA